MPAISPIQGNSQFFTGATSTYTNATAGGSWSIANTSIATINVATGIATGVAAGSTQVIYTVGSDVSALNITVNAKGRLANGFNPTVVLNALRNEVLWPSQGTSNSGRYFTDFHTLVDEAVLADLANLGSLSYDDYIQSLNDAVILEAVNLVYTEPQLIDSSMLVLNRSSSSLKTTPIVNADNFSGFGWRVKPGDYGMKITAVTLFFTEAVSFNLYLYNDFSLIPKATIPVSAQAYEQVTVDLSSVSILNYLSPTDNKGGWWFLGYKQSDLGTAKALTYSTVPAYFRGCEIWPFTSPIVTDVLDNDNFDRSKINRVSQTNGLNLEISTMVDATNNIVSNPALWGNLIGLKMACRIVETYQYSARTNGVERKIKELGGLDELNTLLNGRPYNYMTGVPKVTGLIQMTNDAAKVIKQGFRRASIC